MISRDITDVLEISCRDSYEEVLMRKLMKKLLINLTRKLFTKNRLKLNIVIAI